jgi:hypothetical protein
MAPIDRAWQILSISLICFGFPLVLPLLARFAVASDRALWRVAPLLAWLQCVQVSNSKQHAPHTTQENTAGIGHRTRRRARCYPLGPMPLALALSSLSRPLLRLNKSARSSSPPSAHTHASVATLYDMTLMCSFCCLLFQFSSSSPPFLRVRHVVPFPCPAACSAPRRPHGRTRTTLPGRRPQAKRGGQCNTRTLQAGRNK